MKRNPISEKIYTKPSSPVYSMPPAEKPDYTSTLSTADSLTLFMQGWEPDEPPRSVIVIVHGYGDHSSRYADLASHFVQQGHTVQTYDQRGHGRSEGRRAYINTFDQYLDDLRAFLASVRQRFKKFPVYLLGQSMGGAIAVLYCLEREADFQGLVLCSAALKAHDDMAPLLQKLSSVAGRLLPRLPTISLDLDALSRDPAVVRWTREDLLYYHGRMPARTGSEMLRAMQRIDQQVENLTLPLLLIHGTADKITDPAGSIACYERANSDDKTLGLYPDLYHETFNEPEKEQVIEEITTWLDEHL